MNSRSRSVLQRRSRVSLPVLLLLAAAAAPSPAADPSVSMKVPQRWSGIVIYPKGYNPGLTADAMELTVSKVSSDAEVAGLAETFRQGGQGALREAMFRIPSKGWINFGKLVGAEMNVIRVVDLPDGRRRLRVFSDHPMRLVDKSDPPIDPAHPFGYLELIVDSSGQGSGTLLAAAALEVTEEGLTLQSAGAPAINVTDVMTDTPPPKR